MKSGTSYLQSRLFANRRRLLDRGVLVPGRRWADQIHAYRSLVRDDGLAWERQATEMLSFDGTSVVSMEFLGHLRPPAVERAVATLADADELRIIVTARDLNRNLPAMWQETIQNGETWTWQEYLAGAETWRPEHRRPEDVTPAGRNFWSQQNLYRTCRTWSRKARPGRLTLITVPAPGAPRDLLWERFCGVVGVDPSGLRDPRGANESIGAASALMLRRLNELLEAEGLSRKDGIILRKRHLAKQILGARKAEEPTIGLPVAPWVEQQSREVRKRLKKLRMDVVGDLDELDPVPVPGIDPATIDEAEVTRAALAGLAGLLAQQIRGETTNGVSPDVDPEEGGDDGLDAAGADGADDEGDDD